MTTLTKQARETIKESGLTIAGYKRWNGYESGWGGDRCGCPDDRCIGFHHFTEDDCGCLPVLLDQYAESLARGEATYLDALTRRAQPESQETSASEEGTLTP